MSKKTRQNVRTGILEKLGERKTLTYTQIQKALSTNYLSVRENCEELENYGLIKVEKIENHPRNGHVSNEVSLTENGMRVTQNIKKKLDKKSSN